MGTSTPTAGSALVESIHTSVSLVRLPTKKAMAYEQGTAITSARTVEPTET